MINVEYLVHLILHPPPKGFSLLIYLCLTFKTSFNSVVGIPKMLLYERPQFYGITKNCPPEQSGDLPEKVVTS